MENTTGSWVALAGVVVTVLHYFGINATVDAIAQVIGSIIIVVGIVKQLFAHKRLAAVARTAGAIR